MPGLVVQITGRQFNYPPSFLFRYLEVLFIFFTLHKVVLVVSNSLYRDNDHFLQIIPVEEYIWYFWCFLDRLEEHTYDLNF